MVSEEREGLARIRSLRLSLWILILALIPVVWLAIRFTHSSSILISILVAWVAGVVHFASRIAFSHCPRCRNYFHATAGTPSFWNLVARHCTHCGLPLRRDRVMYPGMTY
jgi:hypothetical protein